MENSWSPHQWVSTVVDVQTFYETPTKKRRHLFSTRVVKQMANPRVRRTSGFHFLTTSVEKRCLRLSWSFMLSHKVIHLKGMCHRLNLNKTTTNGLVRVWDISSSLENIMSFTDSLKSLNYICTLCLCSSSNSGQWGSVIRQVKRLFGHVIECSTMLDCL